MTDHEHAPEFTVGPGATEPSINVQVAFLMYLDDNGHWCADPAVARPLLMGRVANMNDYSHAAADLTKDVITIESSQRTMNLQMEHARAMAQQMESQRIAAAAASGVNGERIPDLSRLRARGN